MKSLLKIAACAAALTLAAGCGEERGADGLRADENERLNEAASSLVVIDTSPDSLVANEGALPQDAPAPAPAGDAATDNVQ